MSFPQRNTEYVKPLFSFHWVVLLLLSPYLLHCSTVAESFDDNPPQYHESKDDSGHTVYRSKRIVLQEEDSSSVADTIYNVLSLVDTASQLSNAGTVTSSVAHVEEETPQDTESEGFHSISSSLLARGEAMTMDLSYEALTDYLSFAGGVAFFSSDRVYGGFQGLVRAHLPWKISPFVGTGLYIGDSKECSYDDTDYYGVKIETCEKYFLFSPMVDAGLLFRSAKNFHWRIFARRYGETKQGDQLGNTLYGAQLSLVF